MKYMTKEDVFQEIFEKTNRADEFEEYLKSNGIDNTFMPRLEQDKFVHDKVRMVVDDLYNLDNNVSICLSARDTLIIRKLYGVMNSGWCEDSVNIREEFNLKNVGTIKKGYFNRIRRIIRISLERTAYKKKEKYFFEQCDMEPKYWDLNCKLHNGKGLFSKKLFLIGTFLREYSKEELVEKTSDIRNSKTIIRNDEDFKKNIVCLNEKELFVLENLLKINGDKSVPFFEIVEQLKTKPRNIMQIEEMAILKISYSVSNNKLKTESEKVLQKLDKEFDYNISIKEIKILSLIEKLLEEYNITTLSELLKKSTEYLENIGLTSFDIENVNELKKRYERYIEESIVFELETKKAQLLNEINKLDLEIEMRTERINLLKSGGKSEGRSR